MQYILLGIAVTISLLYLPYLAAILIGNPSSFETKAVLTLAMWIREVGPRSRRYLEFIYLLTAVLETVYFSLVLVVIHNTFLWWFTIVFIGFEMLHLFKEVMNLQKFFAGNLVIKDILYWRYERLSCLLFFMHTILLVFNLVIFI